MARVVNVRSVPQASEAIFFEVPEDAADVSDFIRGDGSRNPMRVPSSGITFVGLHGETHTVLPGMWLVRAWSGDFYPVRAEVFAVSYALEGAAEIGGRGLSTRDETTPQTA